MLFLMTRAGEYNDELMLVDRMIGVGCFADESHEGRNALCLRQQCCGLSHADKTITRGTSNLPHNAKDKHADTRSELSQFANGNGSMYYIRPMLQP